MKRKFSIFIALAIVFSSLIPFISGCDSHDFSSMKTTAEYFAEDSTDTSATKFYYSCKKCGKASDKTFEYGKKNSERLAVNSNAKNLLDGKKILFAGCSYNFYGKIVIDKEEDITSQEARVDDKGYFYELCKQNGANVSVTNWCFGNHGLPSLLGTSCSANRKCGNGFNHLEELKDRYYDYVSLLDIVRENVSQEEYLEEIKGYMKIFTDVNPNCKFIFSIPSGAYWHKSGERVDFKEKYRQTVYAKEIAKLDNVVVMDWGRLIYDLITAKAKVPGSQMDYNVNSFIVADKYHPNLLTGYINTLMTYCLITGETAVGQPINLENDLEPDESAKFNKKYYTSWFYGGVKTNFIEIMDSPTEMQGIQKLVNRYIDMDTYLYY